MSEGHSSDSADRLFRWQAYGGLGEVGMNCMLFRFGKTAVPVDAGILFADPNDFGIEALSADYLPILESYRPEYWVFTHAHEDHIGAASAIFAACERARITPPKLLAPRFAAALLREKLANDERFPQLRKYAAYVQVVDRDSKFSMTDDVDVRFIETRHSTPDSCSIGFEWRSPSGPLRIIHTADFKLDAGRFEDGVKDLGIYDVHPEEPDFLFVDSTNAERPGHSVSELEITRGLETLISEAQGRVFITLFSSNLYRVASILAIAARCGRYVTIAGRSLQTAYRLGDDLKIFDDAPDFSEVRLLDAGELARHDPSKQLVICSGSQGELRSVLSRLAAGEHPDFVLDSGDTVIFSSKLIPGNEKSVGRLMNGLLRQGAIIQTTEEARQRDIGPIHASGHARSGEIRDLMRHLRPRQIVPVHGELRQLLACAKLAQEEGAAWGLAKNDIHVTENGTQLSFECNSDGRWKLQRREEAYEPLGRLLRFDKFVCPSRDPFLWVRKRAASGGCLLVSLDSGGRFRISAEGIWPVDGYDGLDREKILADIEEWVFTRYKILKKMGRDAFGNTKVETEAADELGRHVRKLCGLRPYVIFHWMEQG